MSELCQLMSSTDGLDDDLKIKIREVIEKMNDLDETTCRFGVHEIPPNRFGDCDPAILEWMVDEKMIDLTCAQTRADLYEQIHSAFKGRVTKDDDSNLFALIEYLFNVLDPYLDEMAAWTHKDRFGQDETESSLVDAIICGYSDVDVCNKYGSLLLSSPTCVIPVMVLTGDTPPDLIDPEQPTGASHLYYAATNPQFDLFHQMHQILVDRGEIQNHVGRKFKIFGHTYASFLPQVLIALANGVGDYVLQTAAIVRTLLEGGAPWSDPIYYKIPSVLAERPWHEIELHEEFNTQYKRYISHLNEKPYFFNLGSNSPYSDDGWYVGMNISDVLYLYGYDYPGSPVMEAFGESGIDLPPRTPIEWDDFDVRKEYIDGRFVRSNEPEKDEIQKMFDSYKYVKCPARLEDFKKILGSALLDEQLLQRVAESHIANHKTVVRFNTRSNYEYYCPHIYDVIREIECALNSRIGS